METLAYTQEVIPAIKKLKIGESVTYPIKRSNVVRSSINNLHMQFEARYTTRKDGVELIVTRVKDFVAPERSL